MNRLSNLNPYPFLTRSVIHAFCSFHNITHQIRNLSKYTILVYCCTNQTWVSSTMWTQKSCYNLSNYNCTSYTVTLPALSHATTKHDHISIYHNIWYIYFLIWLSREKCRASKVYFAPLFIITRKLDKSETRYKIEYI